MRSIRSRVRFQLSVVSQSVLAVIAAALLASAISGSSLAARGDATFYRGDRVEVRYTGGGLNVRSGPGTGNAIRTTLQENQAVTVVEGPVWSGGFGWYKVTGYDSRGSTGWSAGYWLFGLGATSRAVAATSAVPEERSAAPQPAAAQPAAPQPAVAPQPAPASGPTHRVVTTGYNGAEFGSSGYMANGQRVYWGAVAVDPRYIPLGTRMYISGYGDKVFVASDTGSAIKGWKIDIWFPSVGQARAYGTQSRTITIIR